VTRLTCYHGSPGAASDFERLRNALAGLVVVGVPRAERASEGFFLGYSWGAHPAICQGSEAPDCRGLILVSPYLKAAQPRGAFYLLLLRTVLAVPPLRRKFARDFLVKTAAPSPVPESYQALSATIEQGLYRAVQEKSIWSHDTLSCLKAFVSKPVLIIYGEQDAVEGVTESVAGLRARLPNAEGVAIPDGGHALLWTHTECVAQAIATFTGKHGGD
jgi:pimeloyl-ACP methyl ester carboxylesterase